MADAFDELEDSKQPAGGGDYAPWWNTDNFEKEVGDQVIGVIINIHQYTDPGGDDHNIYTLREVGRGSYPKGTEIATPTHKQLKESLDNAGAGVGDLVLAEYEGEVKTDNGFNANTYQISILAKDEWRETENADEIQEVFEGGSGN